MPNYSNVFDRLVRRAIADADSDLSTFIETAVDTGIPPDQVERLLLRDLDEEGAIFGRFIRSLRGAATQATLAATRQGTSVAEIQNNQTALNQLRGITQSDINAMIDAADPEALTEVERATSSVVVQTWVASLINTCHRCLPLHLSERRAVDWLESGISPATIHSGWISPCYCRLVESSNVDRDALAAPLKRVKVKGKKGVSVRSLSQMDLDRSIEAARTASQTLEGRRTIRLLGQALSED